MDENPYKAPQAKTDGNPSRPSYDPFAIQRQVGRVFWSLVFALLLVSLWASSR